MADTATREIGRLEDGIAEIPLRVGVDGGVVTVGCPGMTWRLSPELADELAALIITAWWDAGGGRHRD